MLKTESIKELIFVVLTVLLMIGVIGVFVYMVKTEKGSVQMINFLSSIRSDVEDRDQVEDSIDKDLLNNKKFQELQADPTPAKEFDAGNKNPFRSSDE